MTKVLSVINLKGGVGKTTLTVAVAEVLAAEGAGVLVMDLDPQTNSTLMLIGEEKWREIDKQGNTIFRLFDNAMGGNPVIPLEEIILSPTSIVKGRDGRGEFPVDLVPSSMDLIQVQDRLVGMPSGMFHTRAPATVLQDAARSALDKYEFVLVDCPPNLGVITLNGLLISNGFIIPTIPDILSTYGIPQIVNRVGEFSEETGKNIPLLGIAPAKFRKQAADVHNRTLTRLRNGPLPVFETEIGEHVAFARAAAPHLKPHTVKERWQNLGEQWIALAGEIRQKLENL